MQWINMIKINLVVKTFKGKGLFLVGPPNHYFILIVCYHIGAYTYHCSYTHRPNKINHPKCCLTSKPKKIFICKTCRNLNPIHNPHHNVS